MKSDRSTTETDKILISIIIVNYNGKKFFDDCLRSVLKFVPFRYEVVVVDNASSDGSASYLEEHYPWVKLVKSEKNLGFTGGNNLGASLCEGRYFLLLNNDTVIKKSLAPLIELMSSHGDIGAVGCRLIYGDGRQQESVGYIPSPSGLVLSWSPLAHIFQNTPMFRRTVAANSSLYNEINVEVPWISGAFLLTRRDLWENYQGLDERYFMYMEDTDYCRRLREGGKKIIYSAACEVVHYEGAGREWVGERALLNSCDSYLVYVNKFYGNSAVFGFRACLASLFFARSIYFKIAAVLGGSDIRIDKSRAFWRATKRLLCGFKQHQVAMESSPKKAR